ncbi:SH3 domain-containing protein [uncultured Ferrimonas sp.]|uniref:SH3 domain-containing protein n=1 Tax=uncultured Ferrimonas sp. TaxID=432640 RepID=UPI002632FEF6|nr:SH3 domain-containing protein [uncultured Ferrimonas sp.]
MKHLPSLALCLVFCSWFANGGNNPLLTTIAVPLVELHSGPGIGYPVVQVLEQGEDVTLLLTRTSWIKVQDKRGQQGWVPSQALTGLLYQSQPLLNAQANPSFALRHWESGVLYGDLEGANFYNIYADIALSDVFSAELSAGKALGKISDSSLFELMLMSHLVPEWPVVPYVGIGGGYISTSPHGVIADGIKRDHALMSATSGIKYHISRNFIVRAEYRLSLALTDRDQNEEIETWKIGIGVFF